MQTDEVGIRGLKAWGSPAQMARDTIGYQIDWERTSDYFAGGKSAVKLNGAVAIGADSITVDALTRALFAGEKLQAPDVKTVVVTIAAGGEAIGQTVLSVEALTGPIPAGALLNFGTGEDIVELASAAAEGATTITITVALVAALEAADTATFQGGEHNLEVLEDVAAGATAVPVGNVQFAIADDVELIAQRGGFSADTKFIPEGTIMAKDGTTKKIFPRRDADPDVATEVAIGFLASDASNSRQAVTDSRSGYGLVIGNTSMWENLLPDADADGNIVAGYKTELAANSLGFTFKDYSDSRVS